MKKSDALTYRRAGVNVDEGLELVRRIKRGAKETYRKEVIGGLGGFGGLFSARFKGLKNPVLVSSADGVGTKLIVAFMAGAHSTVGIDLVAMNVNDILTCGAEPLFFLDYVATGRLDAKKASSVIKGVVKGCKQAGSALIGGETAEMPGIYKPGEYDLAGFCVGVVEKSRIIDGKSIKAGDALIGLASSGLHSNGFSLARKVLFEKLGLNVKSKPRGLGGKSLGSVLLTPTRIYVKPMLGVIKKFRVKGIAHITGGGFVDNIPRVFPKDVKAVISGGSWPVPKIFRLIKDGGPVKEAEMLRTFNCGIGMVMAVKKKDAAPVVKELEKYGEKAFVIGTAVKRGRGEPVVEFTGEAVF
ncbi:MAG: phosphoribosylformylglycinamidine cyclo-ligase [Thermodesulfobacteriota bacterium]|nr:MAG: phosphoribosylformylglycinamidine cyclo-ligase [Thermodesulfobacteriota bacterium]